MQNNRKPTESGVVESSTVKLRYSESMSDFPISIFLIPSKVLCNNKSLNCTRHQCIKRQSKIFAILKFDCITIHSVLMKINRTFMIRT